MALPRHWTRCSEHRGFVAQQRVAELVVDAESGSSKRFSNSCESEKNNLSKNSPDSGTRKEPTNNHSQSDPGVDVIMQAEAAKFRMEPSLIMITDLGSCSQVHFGMTPAISRFCYLLTIYIRKPFAPVISYEDPQPAILPAASWDGVIYGLDRFSGRLLWIFPTGSPAAYHERMPHEDSSAIAEEMLSNHFDIKEDQFLFVDMDFKLKVYEKKSGKQPLPNPVDEYMQKLPHISDHMLITRDITTKTFLVNTKTGDVVKQFDLNLPPSDFKAHGFSNSPSLLELIYITRVDFSLVAYDGRSARREWVVTLAEFNTFFPFLLRTPSELERVPFHLEYQKFTVAITSSDTPSSLENISKEYSNNQETLFLPQSDADVNEKGHFSSIGLSVSQLSTLQAIIMFILSIAVIVFLVWLFLKKRKPMTDSVEVGAIKIFEVSSAKVTCGKARLLWGTYNGIDAVIKEIEMDMTDQIEISHIVGIHHNIVTYVGYEVAKKYCYIAFERQCNLCVVIYGSSIEVGNIRFCIDHKLPEGDNADIFWGTYNQRNAVIKRIQSSDANIAEKEIEILVKLQHDNVIYFLGHNKDELCYYLAFERCHCNLREFVTGSSDLGVNLWNDVFPTDELLNVMRDIVKGMAYLHSQGIIHMDLKPENVLIAKLADGSLRAKLAYMGLSRKLEDKRQSLTDSDSGRIYGTKTWQAPEVLLNGKKTNARDLFSLGCVLFFCLSKGKHPFGLDEDTAEESESRIEYRITKGFNGRINGKFKKRIPEAYAIIKRLIQFSYTKRPPAATVLEHPFLWNAEKRLSFFKYVHDFLNKEVDPNDIASKKIELKMTALKNEMATIEKKVGAKNWCSRVDNWIKKSNRNLQPNYTDSLEDLVRLIRHKVVHYQQTLPEQKVLKLICFVRITQTALLYRSLLYLGSWEAILRALTCILEENFHNCYCIFMILLLNIAQRMTTLSVSKVNCWR